jgi:hypothetical protein
MVDLEGIGLRRRGVEDLVYEWTLKAEPLLL